MPKFIVKPIKDRDEYVEWSTIVDSPVSCGNRADYSDENPARLDRADATGSSALSGFFEWSHTEFIYHGGYHKFGNIRLVKRENLYAFAVGELTGDDFITLLMSEVYEYED